MAPSYVQLGLGIVALLLCACTRAIDTLSYKTAPTAPTRGGVVFHDRFRAQDGVRIVTSYDGRGCDAISVAGERLARFPGGHCLFLPGDNYFSVLDGPTLFNRDFSILWSRSDLHQHHDAIYDPARDWIWLLTDNDLPGFNRAKDFLHDTVVALDRKTGKTVFSWSALSERAQLESALGGPMTSDFSPVLQTRVWSHFNSIDIVGANAVPPARPGDLVLGETRHGLIFILRPETRTVEWSFTVGMGVGHHSGKYLPGGEILIFLNNTASAPPQFSYWATISTAAKNYSWTQKADPQESVFCDHFGHVERLPNGNQLVSHVSGRTGAAFEITRKGRVVWEWYNDEKDAAGAPLEVYRMTYQPESMVLPYVKRWRDLLGAKPREADLIRAIESPRLLKSLRHPHHRVLTETVAAGETEAERLMNERELLLMSMYKDYPSPYPGAITTKSRCAPEQRPRRATTGTADATIRIFELTANERLAYGGCSKEDRHFRSLYILIHCRKQAVLHSIKVFIEEREGEAQINEWLHDLKCTTG